MRLRNVYLADVSNISIDNDDVNISSSSSISFFSKYLWVESLKNKTAKEVVNLFKKIFENGRKCKNNYEQAMVQSLFQK